MAPSEIPMSGIAEGVNGAQAGLNFSSSVSPLDATRLTYQLTTSPREVPASDDPTIVQQKTCTDHMITCQWTESNGWAAPKLEPYGPISLMPTASVLHYATECFEGMKLYRGYDGRLRLFRPNLNCKRLLTSASRITLPAFDPEEVQKLIAALCAKDAPKWLPKERAGSFLYIRPTMIATDPGLGVKKPQEALLYIMLCLFPEMDISSGGLKLLASMDDIVRAWPGGFGYAKVGANYGPSLIAQGEARRRNFDQILWLFGDDYKVTEAGASNFFVVWRTREGKTQLVTAPLSDRLILDGVTRRSVLELARERLTAGVLRSAADGGDLEPLEIVERYYTMPEIAEAYAEGRLIEAFAAGTAFFVSQVSLVGWKDQDIKLPLVGSGYTMIIKGWLAGIMYGKERHDWGYVVEEDDVQAA